MRRESSRRSHNQINGDKLMASADDILKALNGTNSRLDSLIGLGQYANQALYYLSQQNDTIICALEHISQNTCNLVTQSHIQTGLQEKIADSVCKLADLYASVHADAELQRHRLHELREQIERCCPPEKPPPACTYQPCPAPGQLPPPPQSGGTIEVR